jgi:uncharacterized membrane protein YqgA involved in biofilm formation
MPGIGVIVNVAAVIAGTFVGLVFGGIITDRLRATAFKAIGLSTIIIGASMAISGLSAMGKTAMGDYAALVLVGSLVVGGLLGEVMRIEAGLERFGTWLQTTAHKLPFFEPRGEDTNGEGHTLVDGFVTASLLFCVGAMTVLGSIQDGLGRPSVLYLKSALDGVASVALASTLGVGVGLSIIPVAVIQGGIALGASGLQPVITPAVIHCIEAAGGALILAIGFDLSGIKRLPVGNLLPAIVLAALAGKLLG